MPNSLQTRRGGKRRNGVQSIGVGFQLLEALASAHGPMHLGELAGAAGMSASKARRYLVSLLSCDVVAQDQSTGRYDLGPMALRMGLATLNRQNSSRLAAEAAIDLHQQTDRTVLLTIWSERGPIILAWHESSSEPTICNLTVGSTLPLLRSASGRLFLSYLPRTTTAKLIARELKSDFVRSTMSIQSNGDVSALIDGIRTQGIAATDQLLLPGLGAVAAPIFDHRGQIVATLGIVGLPGTVEGSGSKSAGTVVKQKADSVSHNLGFVGEGPGRSFVERTEKRPSTSGPSAAIATR
jgi:DNA-binding IclR family transcriptional regulator